MSTDSPSETNGHKPAKSIDWESLWTRFGDGLSTEMSWSQLTTVVEIGTDAADVEEASELIDTAREEDELDYTGSGFILAGAVEGVTSKDEEVIGEDELTAEQDTETVQKSESQSATDAETTISQSELEDMQARQDALSTQLDNFREENAMLKEAVANLCGVNRVLVDELPDAAREQRATNQRVNATVEKISQQMDSLGDVVDEKKNTKKNRVIMVRKHLVQKNENSESEYRMTYTEVQALFSTPGEDDGISDSYAHTIMTAAAQGDRKDVEAHDAFELVSGTGKKKLRVGMEKIEQGSFYSPKNRGDGEGA